MSPLQTEICVYWGPRREDPHECAVRLARMFENLRGVDPIFGRWFLKGFPPTQRNRSPSTPLPGLDALTHLFENSKHYQDVPRKPIPHLGYRIGGSNGRPDDESLGLLVHAGAWTETRNFPNTVSMHLGWFNSATGALANAPILGAALHAIVTAWDADWGRVYDRNYKNPVANPPQVRDMAPFRSGWIVYLASGFADRIVPPPQTSVEKVPGHGLMIYATRETFDLDNLAHVAAADAIQDALEPIQGMVHRRI